MKTNTIKINRVDRMTTKKRDSIIKGDNTINLNSEITSTERYTRRRISKQVNKMPHIAKAVAIIGVFMIMIGGLGKLNAEEIKFEDIVEKPTINAEDKKIVINIPKEEIKTVEVKKVAKKQGLKVTAIVKPTVKNGGLKTDGVVIMAAMKFLRKWEGTHLKAYWDVKRYSICNGTPSFKGEVVTEDICDKRLKERVQTELLRINRTGANLHWRKKVALISSFYNLGYKHNIMTYAARGDDKSVKFLLNKYVMAGGEYSKGLANRRSAEIEMYSRIK